MNNFNTHQTSNREDADRLNRDFRVCMACVVDSVNDCVVDVIPAFRERIMDKSGRSVSHEDMQPIEDVPVSIIGGVKYQVEEGDHGIIIFHDVSLDEYLDNENIADLSSVSRHHDYTDAIFIPMDIRCGAHEKSSISINKTNIKVGNSVVIEGDKITVGDDVEINGNEVTVGNTVIKNDEVSIDDIDVKKTLETLALALGITLPVGGGII